MSAKDKLKAAIEDMKIEAHNARGDYLIRKSHVLEAVQMLIPPEDKPPIGRPTCRTCGHFAERDIPQMNTNRPGGIGYIARRECHINPPTGHEACWPIVTHDDWCSKHTALRQHGPLYATGAFGPNDFGVMPCSMGVPL